MIAFNGGEPYPYSTITWNNTSHWTKQELKCTTAFQKYMAEYDWEITEFPVAFPPPASTNPEGGPGTPGYPDRFKDVSAPAFKVAKGTEFESDWTVVATLSSTTASAAEPPRRCLGIYLMLTKEAQSCKKIVDCSIKILGSNGEVLESAQLNQVFEDISNSWGWRNYKELEILYRERELYLGNDNTLHVQVKMTIFGNLVSYTRSRSDLVTRDLKNQIEATAKGHHSNMKSLLDAGMMSDAVILCGPREFPVHVNILSAQSEVFQKTFEKQWAEGNSKVLDVQGVEPETMSLLLQYIYSGDIPALLRSLGDDVEKTSYLIQAADMYLFQDLKDTCFLHLLDQISAETAGTLTVLAYYHNPNKRIKSDILAYCLQNWIVLTSNPHFLKSIAMKPEAFREYFHGSKVPPYSPFRNPKIAALEPESHFRLPFPLKMFLGSYFAALSMCIGKQFLRSRFHKP